MNKDIPISKLYINNKLEYDLKVEDNKEKVQQILTKYTISELVEYHIEAVDRINKAIEYIEPKMINEYLHTDYINKMLDILRGEDNE